MTLFLTARDRRFLRELCIDPEPTVLEQQIDILTAPRAQWAEPQIIISDEIARAIIAQYGELSLETYEKWRGIEL